MQKDTRKNRGHPLSRKLLCIILAAGMLFTSAVSDTAYANDAEHPPETIEQTENVNNDDSETEQDTESEQSSEVKQNTESDEMVQDESSYQDAQVQDVQAEEDESNHDNEVMATSSSVQTSATLTNIGQIAGITVSSDRGRYDYYSSNKPNYARIIKFIPRFTDTYYISSVSSFDTYGRLYDGNMNSLTSDDDSAGNRQFKLTYRCEVGKTYYIAAGGYNSSSHTEELAVTITHDHTFDNNKRCVKCDFRQIYAILYNTGELHFQYWDTADPTKGSVVDKYQIASSYLYNPTAIPWFMKTNSIVKVTSDAISCSAGGIISMTNWFRNCSKLTSLDLSKFDTSGVTNMNGMFSYCSSLTSLDVSNFDTSKVTDMGSMFSGCSNLKAINLRGKFSTESLKSCDNIFTGTTADLLCDGNKKNAFPAEAYDYGKYIVRGPEFVYTGSQIVENNLQSMVLKPYKKDVKFDANGGAGTITIHVGVNDAIFNDSRWWSRKNICNNFGSLDDGMGYSYPTKSFYTFRGFFTQDGKELSNVNLITEDVYYAHWTPISYEINYNLNGGSISGQKTFFNIETDSFTLPTPTRNGYTFTGWTGSNGATAQKSVTIAKGSTGNKSYTANWTPTNYSISYNLNGGSLSGQKTSYNIETANFALPQPTRSGYTFTGWTGTGLSSATKSVTVNKGSTGNRSYTANWSANGYTISFNYNKPSTAAGAMSGNGTTSKGVTYAAAYGTLPQPSMPGWTFNGWYTAASGGSRISATTTYTAAGNQTLYAHWTLNTYSISYNANGGSLSGQKTSYNVNTDSFALPTPTKNGYTFTGWTGSNGTTAQKSVTIAKGSTGNRNYTANWTPTNYSISYTLNGGSLNGQRTSYNIETANFTLPMPTRNGYTFTGWTGSNGTTAQKSVTITKGSTGNRSYTAHWTPVNYTISYNANGGSLSGQKTSYNIETATFTLPTPTRTGYTFTGWTGTGLSGLTKTVTVSKGSTGNRTYTAHFEKTVTATFKYYNNQIVTVTGKITDSATSVAVKAPAASGTPSGYTFRGWSTSSAANASVNAAASASVTISANMTYYASYSKNVTATFHYCTLAADNYTYTNGAQKSAAASATQYLGYAGAVVNSNIAIPSAVTASHGGASAQNYVGVSKDTNSASTVTPTTAYTKYYAVYTEPLKFYYYNGTNDTSTSVTRRMLSNGSTYSNSLSASAPAPAAYDGAAFAWWSCDSGVSDSSSLRKPLETGVNSLYAVYKKNVSISYNANDGSEAPAAQSGTKYYTKKENGGNIANPSITVTSSKPSRSGYNFSSWNTSANGNGTVYKAGTAYTVSANVTLYAHWTPITWTVKYDANGGSGTMANTKHTYGANIKTTANAFTKTGYSFAYWNVSRVRNGKTEWLYANADNSWINGSSWYEKGKAPSNLKLYNWPDTEQSNSTTYIDGDVITLHAQWTINTYTNWIDHWTWGYIHQEGNNGNKTAFHLDTTAFQSQYGSTFTMDFAKAVKVPNGFYLLSFGTSSINGVWKDYQIGAKVIQKECQMGFQYDYRPISYSITYNLNGGTNNNANPSTYNVLYGVSLKTPTRVGYTFTGWYDENGNKVTGINEGCNAKFSSADDLYAKLVTRTTGNRTLTAHWSYNPVKVKVPQILTGDSTGKSQFRVKCDDFKAGSIKITVPNNFLYKQTGKADVIATIASKSGNNTITSTNKACTYNITTENGLTAGCWQGSFNIGLTLTKE